MKKLINIKTLLAALTVLAVSSCADEELIQNMGQAGQLHIGSVSVGDNKVASRTDGEEGTSNQEISPKYNEVVTQISVDKLFLNYSFVEESTSLDKRATAEKNTDGTWNIAGDALKPNGNGETWANLKMTATNIQDEGYALRMPDNMGITSWNGASNTRIYQDKVSASSDVDGGITIDKTLTSATLGKMSIALKHEHALLRLEKSTQTFNVNGGTYVKDGDAYQVDATNPLKTLWAVMEIATETIYIPLTSAENNSCLQAIVPVGLLTGFRAVMNVGNNPGFYLDFGITNNPLAANTQYNLTLTITENLQNVDILRNDKPGWGTTVNENTLKDWKVKAITELSYSNGTFIVSGPLGLLLLNQWMTGIGDEIKYIFGYNDIDKNASRMSHNITIDDNISFSAEHKIFDLDGTGDNMSNWKPLGDSGNEYTGTFDGNGKTITGLAIFTNNGIAGLADRLGEGGIIKNLTVSGATVNTTLHHTGIISSYTAGIIENCKVISSTVTGGGDYVGAIAGTNNGTIIACEVSGITTVTGTSHVAGIAGSNSGSIVACSTKHDWSSNVTNNLTLNATATDTSNHYSAGLVSENTGAVYGSWTTKVNDANHVDDGIYGGSGVIKNCFSASTIANEKIGDQQNPAETTMNYAIALYNASLEVTNPAYCNWHWNNTPALDNGAPTKTFNAAYVPESKSFKVATYDGLKQICEWMWKGKKKGNNYNDYKELFNPDDWNNDQNNTPNDYVDYPMTNVPGFESNMNADENLSERCKYNITLTSDIDLTDQRLYDLDGVDGLDSNWLYLFGDGTSYEGTFDGAGHKIKGLKIMSKRSQTGLVDVLGPNGVIKNLTLENPVISGSVDGTGFFVSANNGIVENCHIKGNSNMVVTCSSSRHAFDNGAIVGQNAGVVMACTVEGTLSMTGCYSFGGIVGANRNGYVVACRNTSTLSVTHACGHTTKYNGNNCVGSLVGINYQISTTTVNDVTTTTTIEGYVYGSYSNTSGVLVGNSSGEEYTSSTNIIGVFKSPTDVTEMNLAIEKYNESPKLGKSCKWRWSNNGVIKLEKN